MKLLHSLSAQVSEHTFIDSYNHGSCHSLVLIDNGESISLNFNTNCIHKLADMIEKLKLVHESLTKARIKEIGRELESLSHNESQCSLETYPCSNGKHIVDIAF